MQFSTLSLVAALAATVSATYVPSYNTSTPVYPTVYPTGTSAPTKPVGPTPSASFVPFPGAASQQVAGSMVAIVVAGGVALVSLYPAELS